MDCGVQMCSGTGIPDAELRQYTGEARLFFPMSLGIRPTLDLERLANSYSYTHIVYSYSLKHEKATSAMLEFDERPTRP